ncbi:hypothetical protein CBS101457_005816 [Exobasidium rhododendri]|nr:hypothetical protein CBS101457_005816 [Exobasidium rhododendri]
MPKSSKSGSVVTQRLLGKFYDHVETLPAYLVRILPSHAKTVVEQAFAPPLSGKASVVLAASLKKLSNSLVGSSSGGLNEAVGWSEWSIPTTQDAASGGGMAELVQQAQTRILRAGRSPRVASNMLTLGYKEADDRMEGQREVRMGGSTPITNFHLNSNVTSIILDVVWQHLLMQLGPAVILHLLTRIALFVPLTENEGNLMQILGTALTEASELATVSAVTPTFQTNHRKRKRTRHRIHADDHTVLAHQSQPVKLGGRAQTLQERSKSDSKVSLRLPVKRETRMHRSISVKPQTAARPASDIAVARNRIYYARPIRARSGKVAAGLPIVHVFNRGIPKEVLLMRERKKALRTKGIQSGVGTTVIDKATRKARARKVLKYMWPKEHGLDNVLTREQDRWKSRDKWEEYTNREEAIRTRGSIKMPARLQNVARLVSIMLSKHDRLDYGKLLHYCCPSALPHSGLSAKEREEIVTTLSESSLSQNQTQILTQLPNLHSTQASQDPGRRSASSKPVFTKYKLAIGSVSRFAQAVLRLVLPIELMGSHHNLRILLKNVDKFVRLRRYETLSLHQLCQGFRVLDCHWLLPRNKRAQSQRPTQVEMKKRLSLLHELLYYLFDSFLIPLLRTNFYATESAAFRNRTLYFRQDDWATISLPLLDQLKVDCFTAVSKNEAIGIMSGRDFGYSYVRLLPKQTGVRPIVNLRRRSVKIDRNKSDTNQVVQQQQSINNILNVVFHVLNYEKKSDSKRLGSSVFGAHEIYEKMKLYKEALLRQNDGSLPRLYFVKVDLVCAFDSIDQEQLLRIVKSILHHDRYIIQKFSQVMSKRDGTAKSWPRLACAEEDQEDFSAMIRTYGRDYNNVVFSDGVVYTPCERESLMRVLEEHITNNLIKIGKEFCKQRVGIPQGSSLSTLLCCYYLAQMEKEKKLCEECDRDSLLMRYTDDFLFISSSQEKARQFYEKMKKGDATFNVNIAVEKSLHNLEVGISDEMCRLRQDQKLFPWCSYLINTETLSTEYDLSRYSNTSLSDTLSISSKRPFQAFAKLIQSSINNRSHCIFLDAELNGMKVVVGNLYRNFLLTALKFVSYHREVKRLYGLRRNDSYVHQVVLASVHLSYTSINAKMRRMCKNDVKSWQIDQHTFTYLAFDAFIRIFRQRAFSRRWVAPLRAEITTSNRLRSAQRAHQRSIESAWKSCNRTLASMSL